ncbi:hypothetical protein CRG98_026259 [Punica granatum]|uniref:Uncharacterized protein n=1 Tax=Punica granatum TaxID=22663 RepID=A0A2I0JAQ2_PUNGR|nr:hypothetical protein CRG98_026259 [Punica granatum]
MGAILDDPTDDSIRRDWNVCTLRVDRRDDGEAMEQRSKETVERCVSSLPFSVPLDRIYSSSPLQRITATRANASKPKRRRFKLFNDVPLICHHDNVSRAGGIIGCVRTRHFSIIGDISLCIMIFENSIDPD